ncbi:hypothetical protein GCM10009840_28260 [Pseudolysinimonas kribbensis]|uniref:Uncharacterized protein n=1 Tax=Pseudolysinimonas kribbensis TaxID=433641 RepID=A0ABQ6KD35_9MICO|nr:hypothetical protein [Pseudolysinimonas kribbensis]GMA96351.1 hypothetical protein GCM10025881_31750 [Pseudolysinimonas kribbensis]
MPAIPIRTAALAKSADSPDRMVRQAAKGLMVEERTLPEMVAAGRLKVLSDDWRQLWRLTGWSRKRVLENVRHGKARAASSR